MKRYLSFLLALVCACTMLFSAGALADGQYTPGTYEAAAQGNGGLVNVSVTFEADRIAAIEIGEHNETPNLSDPALERIPAMIVEHQSLAIDTVSGATITSNAVLEAVAACVTQANGDVEALKNVEVVVKGEDKTMEADMVVIGSGPAGLLAAAEASNHGLKVIVLEKQASAGGSAIISGGIVYGVDSQAHRDRGLVDDTPEKLVEYWKLMEPDGDPELMRLIAEKSGSTIDMISAMGVQFEEKLTFQGIDTVARALTAVKSEGHYGGYHLIQPIVDTLNANENVTILLETKGEKLITDEAGNVTGVIATNLADNSTLTVHAPATVICTGDIDDCPELMAEFHPDFAHLVEDGTNAGEGHLMAREAGAALEVNDGVFTGAIMPIGGLQVNANGERFTNENNFYNIIWDDLVASMGGETNNLHPFLIIDSKVKEMTEPVFAMTDGIRYTWGELVDKGFDDTFKFSTSDNGQSYKADTLEELAEMINVPYENLKASVDRYNELAELGEDLDFGKAPEYLYKIEEGPFYAWDEYLMVCYFSCGIDVDYGMRALREDGSVVKGLYAAGWAAAEDFKANQYPASGSAICYCMNAGRVAAESVIADLAK